MGMIQTKIYVIQWGALGYLVADGLQEVKAAGVLASM